MKNRLGLSSDEFLKRYTVPQGGENTWFPMVKLKMDSETLACPFVTPEGCSIYEDRPGACRIYPLGRAASKTFGGEARESYFIVNEPHCLGHNEEKEWSIKEWKKDQGIDEYNEMNDCWTEVLTHPALQGQNGLGTEKLQMFYMVSYNPDKFREFVFKTRFLDIFDMERDVIERLNEDEVELMRFGVRWLKFSLFGEETLKIRDTVLEEKWRDMGIN